jgi:GAF domain-containing protein
MERLLRGSADTLAASGWHDSARIAEQFAEAFRFDLDQPVIAQRLYLLARNLRGTEERSSACGSVLNAALKLVGADRGNIQLRHPVTGSLVIAAQSGFDSEFLEYFAVTDDDGSACGRASRQRSQIVIADVNTDPGFAPHREIAAASGFRGVCSTPLLDQRSNLVGVLSTHYERPYRPSPREQAMLRRLGRLVGSALLQPAAPLNGALNGYAQHVNARSRRDHTTQEWRERFAAIADQTADLAEEFASILEQAAQRGDEQRRLRIARTERQIASIQRRNAATLRQSGPSAELLRLPSLKE